MSKLDSSKKLFQYYKILGEKTMEQLSDEQLFSIPSTGLNSISVIVNHIQGNMLSRWTNFPQEDGEKEWRNRDQEFEEVFSSRAQLTESWEAAWQCLFNALNPLEDDDLSTITYIRNEGHTIQECIDRQLAHYAYHMGQIVQLGKFFKGEDWKSLSIPKGKSKEYNQRKFDDKKGDRHFTERI